MQTLTDTLSINTSPTGINISVDGVPQTTPYSAVLADGPHTVIIPAQVSLSGHLYAFTTWSDGSTSNTRTVDLASTTSLTANYTLVTHVLSISSNPVGVAIIVGTNPMITPFSQILEEGSYNIVAPSTLQGNYVFQTWSDGITSTSRTVNLNVDITLQANYVFVPPPTSNLTIQSTPIGVVCTIDGQANATPVTVSLPDGSHTISVPATVTSGGQSYNFLQWENGTANPTRTINLAANTTITATYVANTFTLQVNSTGLTGVPFTINGQTFTTPFSQQLAPGTYNVSMPASLTLLPPSTVFGTWDFQAWADGVTAPTRTVTLTANTSLTANYKALQSWNPNVGYTPVRTTIEQVIGSGISSLGGATLAGGWPWPLNPNGTDPNFDIKRNWRPPGSVLSLANILGPTFVEIDDVVCEAYQHSSTVAPTTEDCSSNYSTVNGSGLMPPNPSPLGCETGTSWGDTTVNLVSLGLPVTAQCDTTTKIACQHVIHIEIDRDWKASGRDGPGNNCDWLSFSNLPPVNYLNKPIDIQGFVYWDSSHITEAYHSFSGWEIHPVTGWRLH